MADEKFRAHLPALAATTAVTLAMSVASSYFGTAGTIGGLLAGCVVSGTGTWWAERAIRRTAAIAQAKARARRVKGRELTAHETAIIEQVHAARRGRKPPYARIAELAAVAAVCALLSLSLLEHLAGKPAADIVRDRPGHGTTLSRWRITGPAPLGTARPAPDPAPSTANSGTGTYSVPVTPADPSPDAAPGSPTAGDAPSPPGTAPASSATAAPGSPTMPAPDAP